MRVALVSSKFIPKGSWEGYYAVEVEFAEKGEELSVHRLLDILVSCHKRYIVLSGDIASQPHRELFALLSRFQSWYAVRGLERTLIRCPLSVSISSVISRDIREFTDIEFEFFVGESPVWGNIMIPLRSTDSVIFNIQDVGDIGIMMNAIEEMVPISSCRPKCIVIASSKQLFSEIAGNMMASHWLPLHRSLDIQLRG